MKILYQDKTKLIGSHNINYTKFPVKDSPDLSVRYFRCFDDRPEMVNKFVLKSHSEKKYKVLDSAMLSYLLKEGYIDANHKSQVCGALVKNTSSGVSEYIKYINRGYTVEKIIEVCSKPVKVTKYYPIIAKEIDEIWQKYGLLW